MRTANRVIGIVAVCVLLGMGCTSRDVLRNLAERGELMEKYEIGPGDTILIEFRLNSDLNRQLTIGPDGKVNLPFAGEVLVSGETAAGLSTKLIDAYSEHLTSPDITVTLVRAASKRIYVFGEVIQPGWIALDRSLTILDALALSGGMTLHAQKNSVQVARLSMENPEVYRLDMEALIERGDALYNLVLDDRDIVYVPPTALAQFGYALNEALFPITSIFTGVEQTSSTKFTLRNYGGTGLAR